MPEEVMFRGHLTVNSIDISAYVTSLNPTFDLRANEDSGTMGDDAMGQDSVIDDVSRIEVSGFQDLDSATGPRAAFAPFWTEAGTTTITYRPKDDAAAADNPQKSGTFAITEYDPASGSHGEKAKFTATLVSNGAVTHAVA